MKYIWFCIKRGLKIDAIMIGGLLLILLIFVIINLIKKKKR